MRPEGGKGGVDAAPACRPRALHGRIAIVLARLHAVDADALVRLTSALAGRGRTADAVALGPPRHSCRSRRAGWPLRRRSPGPNVNPNASSTNDTVSTV
ncbi:hypothetical protein DID96_04910 [Burkholderia sp. Bp8963]|nr:hypothetical protein DID96_04910 [Burkholderia sp. Bp8963]